MKYKLIMCKTLFTNMEEIKKYHKLGFIFDEDEDGEIFVNDDLLPEIEINTLEQLQNFISEYGQIVIHTDTIEIYNDYRE